jgi:succinate dehydrogenase/fumarate reductase iron-sulfur protein
MTEQTFILRVLRYKPGLIDPARFQDFTISLPQSASVLDALETLRLQQDKTLMYRHACHHASCGTCACLINGHERLACTTRLAELDCELITVAPLRGLAVVGDLVVDMSAFYNDLSEDWSSLKTVSNPPGSPGEARPFTRFENCIECGACRSACPVTHTGQPFLGPAALAALNNELAKSPGKTAKLLTVADGPRGVQHCTRALNCSRVCPTGVYPARHIEALRRRLRQPDSQDSS